MRLSWSGGLPSPNPAPFTLSFQCIPAVDHCNLVLTTPWRIICAAGREFARAVGRDTDEVVAEEVAAMQQRGGGIQETHLAELEALTAVINEMASTSTEGGVRQWGEMPELEAYTVGTEPFGSGAACQSTPCMTSPEPLYDHVSAGGVDFRFVRGQPALPPSPTLTPGFPIPLPTAS